MNNVAETSPSPVRWPSTLAELFRQPQSLADRAAALAALLRDFFPQGRWTACRLRDANGPVLTVFPESHGSAVSDQLLDLVLDGAEVRRIALGVVAPIPGGTKPVGFLVVGLPAETEAGRFAGELALTAALVGLQLRAEADANRLRDLRRESEGRDEIVTVGDAMLGLTHDLSNSLNTMMLQASVVQLKAGAAFHEDLALIRREGSAAAGLIRLLQNYRDSARRSRSVLDLNQFLRDVAATIPELADRVRWQLATDPLPVRANRDVLWRLLVRVFRLAAKSTPTAEAILIQSGMKAGAITLLVGPFPARESAETLADLFAPSEDDPTKGGVLDGLAAESLVRLVEARCRVERLPEGGVVALLEWSPDKAAEGQRR